MNRNEKIEQIKQSHIDRISEFEASIAENDKYDGTKVINRLLDVNPMIVYQLFKVSNDDLIDMLGLFHSLRHAFLDDGEYIVDRKVNQPLTEMAERFNEIHRMAGRLNAIKETPVYDYFIKECYSYDRPSLTPEQLDKLLTLHQDGWDYYYANEDKINNGPFTKNDPRIKWRELESKAEDYLISLYVEPSKEAEQGIDDAS